MLKIIGKLRSEYRFVQTARIIEGALQYDYFDYRERAKSIWVALFNAKIFEKLRIEILKTLDDQNAGYAESTKFFVE